MNMDPIGTVTDSGFKADIYSTSLPGEFNIIYRDGSGNPVEEVPLTGVSSYHQRENEIKEHLQQLAKGKPPPKTPDQGDAGEY